jgi:uncharacterized protein
VRPVHVVYRKYDESLHWHLTMEHLGEDEHGLWLGAPPNAPLQKGDEPPVVLSYAHVILCPPGRWWTAAFNHRDDGTPGDQARIYCDITTPVEVSDGQVTMIDLDLDVIRRVDNTVFVDDEDEFAEHQVKYGYPAEVIAGAQASCDWLAANVATSEPFLTAYKPYLDRMISSG